MPYKKSPSGFTLTELLVAITIVTILGTLGFVSYSTLSQNTRDSVRVTDTNNIGKVLELFNVKNKKYPYPSESFDVVYSGYPLWSQGVFGPETQTETGKIFGDLKDPKYDNHYGYSVTQSRKEYQLGVVYERTTFGKDDWRYSFNPIPQAAAQNSIVNYDPTELPGMRFWYDGKDVDADTISDIDDTSIANVGVVGNADSQDFSPFYFDRFIWLDAKDINGDGSEYANGNSVSTWKNKTGGGLNGFVPQTANNHSNPSYSTSPTYTATGFSGQPGVSFDGNDTGDRIVVNRGDQPEGQGFSLAYTFSVNDSTTNHATIMSVGPSVGGEYYQVPGGWQLSRDGLEDQFIFRIAGTITDRTYFLSDGSIDSRSDSVICPSCGSSGNDGEAAFDTWAYVNDDEIHTVFLTYEGNTVTGYLDGTKRFEAEMTSTTGPFGEYFRFFGNRAGTAYLEGKMGEVFITNDRMSLQEISKIEGYFSRKWDWLDDLPVDHPYKTNPPRMDPTSQLDYSRYTPTIDMSGMYDASTFYGSNPIILNNKTVRYPGSMPGINISETNKTHVWRGPIKVSETGDYTFYTNSDDYSFITIDGNVIVDNGGYHPQQYREATINLEQDVLYEFELVYGQVTGGTHLDYGVTGSGVIGYRKYEGFSWQDKSVQENHANQIIPELQPNYSFGQQSFVFESEDYFSFTDEPFAGTDNLEVFFVWESELSNTVQDLDGYVFENEATGTEFIAMGGNGMRAGSSDAFGTTLLGKQTNISSYRLDRSGSGNIRYYLAGQNYHQNTTDVSPFIESFVLGGKQQGFTGNIKEVIAYRDILNTEDRQKVEGLLSHKWRIAHKLPGNHPYYEALLTEDEAFVKLTGNYNGLFVHSNLGDSHIVVATPSIMSSLSSTGTIDITTVIGENRLVYNNYRNVPASYADGVEASEKLVSANGFFFDISEPKIFDGTRSELANYNGISQIDAQVRAVYSNSRTYEFQTNYLEQKNADYVKNILGNIIGINPITPYFCKDILAKRIGSSITYEAGMSGSSGEDVSDGILTLGDGITSVDGDYSYKTIPGDSTEISLEWEEIYDVTNIRIYNGFGDISQNLWAAQVLFYDENDILTHTHTLGNTLGVGVIDVEIPEFITNLGIKKIVLRPVPDYSEIGLREIEVFIGQGLQSGVYTVDSDGIGGKGSYNVYCDMQTDGGGWTKVGENYIDRSNFQNLAHSSRFTGYSSTGSINNVSENVLRSDITPPTEIPLANVLRHSGDSDSYYVLDFTNIPDVEFSSELRIGAWVYGTIGSPLSYLIEYEGGIAQTYSSFPSQGATANQWRYETTRIPLINTLEQFQLQLGRGTDATGTPVDITGISVELFYK